jgi:hypothetical protein
MGGVVSGIFGKKPKSPKAMGGAMFQPFAYTSIYGTARGERNGDEYTFSQQLSPELQALYESSLGQAQPLLSQYLTAAQQPIERFQFDQGGIQDRTAEYFAEQQAMLNPVFQQERQQLSSDLFGSGRLGLQIQGVQPEAAGLAEAQAQALANSAMTARQMAMGEQQQMFGQALQNYGANVQAQQQQLANLLGGFQGAFGTAQAIGGIEQGLIGQAAGLEEAVRKAQYGAAQAGSALQTPQRTDYGMLGGFLSGLSDVRLKENITKIGKIGDINFYSWNWSDKAIEMGAENNPTVGVMAQELLQVMPEAVTMAEDGYYRVDYSKVFNGVQ